MTRTKRQNGAVGVGVALCLALLTACDFGGSANPTPAAGVGSVTPGTAVASGATPGKGTAVAGTPTAFAGPTDTARAATVTAAPKATSVAAPTAKRSSGAQAGQTWRLIGLTGQDLSMVSGSGKLDAPIYAGGIGLYRSDDGGATWTQLDLPAGTRVSEVEVSPAQPQRIFAGSNTDCAKNVAGAQFVSDDGGLSWTKLDQAPYSLQLDAQNADLVTGMTCSGVTRSRDGGKTWAALGDPTFLRDPRFSGYAVSVPASDGSLIYATYHRDNDISRIRVSTDSGKTWGGDEAEYPGVTNLLVDNRKPQRAWAASQKGVLNSSDSGLTWVPSTTGLDAAHNTATNGESGPYQLATISGQYNTSGDLIELYIGTYSSADDPGSGIFSSKDLGQVYSRFGGDLGGLTIHSLYVGREKGDSSDQVVLYAATDDGIHKLALGTVR